MKTLHFGCEGGILAAFRNSRSPHRDADFFVVPTDNLTPQLFPYREGGTAAMPEQELGIYFGGPLCL